MSFEMQKTQGSLSTILIYSFILLSCVVYGLIFSIKWKIGIALLFLIIILIINLYSLEIGIIPVFFLLPFDRLGKIAPESSITFAKIFIGLLIISWFVNVLITKDRTPLSRLKDNPLFIITLLFLVFSLFSIINAHDYDVFLKQIVRRISNIILLFLIINIVNRKELLLKILGGILLAYIFVGLTGLYEMSSGQSILETVWGERETALEYTLPAGGGFRIAGPGGDPGFLALSVIFPALIAFTFLYMRKSKFTRTLLILFIMLMFLIMLATGSRGGLLSLLIGISVLWFFTKMKWKYTIAILGVLILPIFILIISLANPSSPTERYTGSAGSKSVIYRIGFSRMAFSMIKDHPIVGVGTGNFTSEYYRYLRKNPIVPRDAPYHAHNGFLQMWAENGIFGFLVYIALFFVSAGMMVTVIKNTNDQVIRSLAVLFLSCVSSHFFFAGTSNVLENENYWIVFAFTIIVYNLYNEQQRIKELNGLPEQPT